MTQFTSVPDWVQDAVFYQIFPERFANGDPANDPPSVLPWGTSPTFQNFMGGDLQGILDHLPYLKELGINAIYTTPIFSARSNHKYDTADYFKVDPAFGDLELFKQLVRTAHDNGIRIIMDAVFNHCGDGFWAFQDVISRGNTSQYRDWFVMSSLPIVEDPPNYQTCGGAGFLPKLNVENPQVRSYLLEVAVYWLRETGMDGWRLDVPWKISLEFWREFRQAVKSVRPDAYIVAESWRDPLYWLQGDTCDAVMNYPYRDYILDYCARDAMDAEDFDHFTRRLLTSYGPLASSQLNLLGSHDTARLLTVCNENSARAILAFICMLTGVGVPMIYYGDENGMSGENDPDCRRCMEWNSDEWNRDIRTAVQKLIALRHAHPALRAGCFDRLLVFNGVYAFQRKLGEDQVVVVINPRNEQKGMNIPLPGNDNREWVDVLSGQHFACSAGQLILPLLKAQQGFALIPLNR
jgi:glycosidase